MHAHGSLDVDASRAVPAVTLFGDVAIGSGGVVVHLRESVASLPAEVSFSLTPHDLAWLSALQMNASVDWDAQSQAALYGSFVYGGSSVALEATGAASDGMRSGTQTPRRLC